MAKHRMFSVSITDSARFLKMPPSTQNLYFHLGLHADDDGVVEAYTVMKSVGATEDDLKLLVAKEFVMVLNEDLVAYITDWKENNIIRSDRKVDSIYKTLLLQVIPDVELQKKTVRADVRKKQLVDGQPMDVQWTTNGQPMDVQWTTNGQPMDRLSKDKISKDKLSKVIISNVEKSTLFEEVWSTYPRRDGKQVALKAFSKALDDGVDVATIKDGIERYKKYIEAMGISRSFIKMGSTWFNQRCWQDEYDCSKATKAQRDYTGQYQADSEQEYVEF